MCIRMFEYQLPKTSNQKSEKGKVIIKIFKNINNSTLNSDRSYNNYGASFLLFTLITNRYWVTQMYIVSKVHY